nr:MAG TPA: hypothetical protein [Caudoviricetes sp.]
MRTKIKKVQKLHKKRILFINATTMNYISCKDELKYN